jgi:hypothetical protein
MTTDKWPTSLEVVKRFAIFVSIAVLASILAAVSARAAAQPNVAIAKGPPHAGRIFVGVVMRVPAQVKVIGFSCKATVGGRLKGPTTGFREYVGGTYIKPIIHKSYVGGRLVRATCGWRIPDSAAGKLISLQPPGCSDACGERGFTVHFLDLTRPAGRGRDQTPSYQGPTWKIRP